MSLFNIFLSTIGFLVFVAFPAYGVETCRTNLTATDQYSDLSKILECLQQRIVELEKKGRVGTASTTPQTALQVAPFKNDHIHAELVNLYFNQESSTYTALIDITNIRKEEIHLVAIKPFGFIADESGNKYPVSDMGGIDTCPKKNYFYNCPDFHNLPFSSRVRINVDFKTNDVFQSSSSMRIEVYLKYTDLAKERASWRGVVDFWDIPVVQKIPK